LRPELKAEVLPLDLADVDSLPLVAEAALHAFGGVVDVLVNNGGSGFRDLAEHTPMEIDRMMMNVNYFSGVALVKALLPLWLERCEGHVVQISSIQGFFGMPGRTAYAATKHAAFGFFDSLRAEVADSGVSVTMVAPGYIRTRHSQNAARGNGKLYPEGDVQMKGVPPDAMAFEILVAVARRQPEIVSAGWDAKAARVLRCLCPSMLFGIMQQRARKERARL